MIRHAHSHSIMTLLRVANCTRSLLFVYRVQISIVAVQTAGDPLFKRYNSNMSCNPVTPSEPTPVSTPLGGIEEALFRRSCDFANITTLTPSACALVCSSCSSSSNHGASSSSSGNSRPLSLNAQQQQQSVALLREFVQSTGSTSSRPNSANYGNLLAERAVHAAATSSSPKDSVTTSTATVACAAYKGSLGAAAIECLANFSEVPRQSRLMTT
jgi:hypothetical protein